MRPTKEDLARVAVMQRAADLEGALTRIAATPWSPSTVPLDAEDKVDWKAVADWHLRTLLGVLTAAREALGKGG